MDEFTLYGLSMVTGMAYVVFEFYSFLIMLCLAIVGGIIFTLAMFISYALTGDNKPAIGLPAPQSQITTQAPPQDTAEPYDRIEYIGELYNRFRQEKHPEWEPLFDENALALPGDSAYDVALLARRLLLSAENRDNLRETQIVLLRTAFL